MEKAAERQKSRQPGPVYTVILHGPKQKLELTVNEYVLADSVHKLSGNHSPIPGWCYASKGYLGKILGVSERSIFNLLKRLREKGVVDTHSARKNLLRTTKRWVDTVEVTRERLQRP